jgi:hypothetical protein
MGKVVDRSGGIAAINTELGANTMDNFVAAYDAIKAAVNAHKSNFTPAAEDLTS